jgi:gliding motility-associated-like protein
VVTDTVYVALRPAISLGPDTALCPGKSIVLQASQAGTSYLWSTGATSQQLTVNQAGTYWLDVSDPQCFRSDTVFVSKVDLSLDIGTDRYLCEGQEIELTAIGTYSWLQWSTGSSAASVFVNSTGWLSATARQEHCELTDSLLLSPCSRIRFPNTFTPNNDQKNDYFLPDYQEIENYKLSVFNRWGVVVFQSDEPSQGWDGRYHGSNSAEGTYFYTATYRFIDKNGVHERTETGGVTLLR